MTIGDAVLAAAAAKSGRGCPGSRRRCARSRFSAWIVAAAGPRLSRRAHDDSAGRHRDRHRDRRVEQHARRGLRAGQPAGSGQAAGGIVHPREASRPDRAGGLCRRGAHPDSGDPRLRGAEKAVVALRVGTLEDGTAIGSGLATSVNRLRRDPAKSKVVLLLTDGVNNRGAIDPRTAADAAAAFGIKVYTVAVGTQGEAGFRPAGASPGSVTRCSRWRSTRCCSAKSPQQDRGPLLPGDRQRSLSRILPADRSAGAHAGGRPAVSGRRRVAHAVSPRRPRDAGGGAAAGLHGGGARAMSFDSFLLLARRRCWRDPGRSAGRGRSAARGAGRRCSGRRRAPREIPAVPGRG